MKKIVKNKQLESIQNDSEMIREKLETKNNDFITFVGNRAKIVGESKTSVLFHNKVKESENKYRIYYLWIPKSLVFKNDYSLYVNINIPNSWELTPYDNYNDDYSIDFNTKSAIDDIQNIMGFVLKNKKNNV